MSTETKCHAQTNAEQFDQLNDIIEKYDYNAQNLINILHYAQAIFGYLPDEVQKFIAKKLSIPISKVSGVITFYSFFSSKPKGKYTISVCLGTACYVRGGKKILEKLKDLLGIDVGETTNDRLFSLQVMRCIGACGLAPAISINDKIYKRVNVNRLEKIIQNYKDESRGDKIE